jgi:hypothetical protein
MPGLNQRAIHSEVLIAHEPLRLAFHLGKETLRHCGVQQAITVLRKHRVVPDRIINAQSQSQRNSKL